MTDRDLHDLVTGARALLIDLDGTLVDSTAPVTRAWTAFAVRHGLDADTVIKRAHGRPSRETVRSLLARDQQAVEEERLEQDELTDTEGTRALPGAHELLRVNKPLAIVTSCSRALMAVRLRATGLPVPAVSVTADDVKHGKPDPECFLLGARALNASPDACLVLEDSPAGIAAARAAGMPVIAVRGTHVDRELVDADAIVEDPGAVADLLRSG